MLKLDDKWVLCKKQIRSNAMTNDEIGFRIITKEKRNRTCQGIRLRIGGKVADKMGWKDGDKICLYFDKDFQRNLLLVKSDNGIGNRLTFEKKYVKNKSRIFTLAFAWDGEGKLDDSYVNNTAIDHEINKNGTITFTLP